jgi:hypothetical protein
MVARVLEAWVTGPGLMNQATSVSRAACPPVRRPSAGDLACCCPSRFLLSSGDAAVFLSLGFMGGLASNGLSQRCIVCVSIFDSLAGVDMILASSDMVTQSFSIRLKCCWLQHPSAYLPMPGSTLRLPFVSLNPKTFPRRQRLPAVSPFCRAICIWRERKRRPPGALDKK